MLRLLFQLFLFFFPWPIRRIFLCGVYGYDIDRLSRIGFSVVMCEMLVMKKGARIGNLTLVKGLRSLSIGEYGSIGNLNWVTGFPLGSKRHFVNEVGRDPSLFVGDHAAITNRHLIDCTDRVSLGDYSTMAGFRSQILTHSIDMSCSRQACKPVEIGRYCFVGTACVFLGGAKLPDYSVLGAMSLLRNAMFDDGSLYSGVPAKWVCKLDMSFEYFSRPGGYVN